MSDNDGSPSAPNTDQVSPFVQPNQGVYWDFPTISPTQSTLPDPPFTSHGASSPFSPPMPAAAQSETEVVEAPPSRA